MSCPVTSWNDCANLLNHVDTSHGLVRGNLPIVVIRNCVSYCAFMSGCGVG